MLVGVLTWTMQSMIADHASRVVLAKQNLMSVREMAVEYQGLQERLAAIDSIPWYIHHATNFFAVVPRVEHSDLPGVHCDYRSWQQRGWCRLEEQMQVRSRRRHRVSSVTRAAAARRHCCRRWSPCIRVVCMVPGLHRARTPSPTSTAHPVSFAQELGLELEHRRPLVIHSAKEVTSIDAYEYFYVGFQRKTSVFTGEFTCCRLNHQSTTVDEDGVEVTVTIPCDKERIRPMVEALWGEKRLDTLSRIYPRGPHRPPHPTLAVVPWCTSCKRGDQPSRAPHLRAHPNICVRRAQDQLDRQQGV